MGICYGNVAVPEVPLPLLQEEENNGAASNEDENFRISESPSVDGISKPSPFPFYIPSPANSNFCNSPANSTPRRFFSRGRSLLLPLQSISRLLLQDNKGL